MARWAKILAGLALWLGMPKVWAQPVLPPPPPGFTPIQPVPLQAAPSQPPPVAASPQLGRDLEQLVKLFINESLTAGKQVTAVNYGDLYKQLLASSYGNTQPAQDLEYEKIRSLLKRYGDPVDRLLTPPEFKSLLNRPRPALRAETVADRIVYLAIPELTPATSQQVRDTLFTQDYSRGLILDLRGSIGYEPQVVADVARIFLPRSIAPLVTTQDRFGQIAAWDSPNLPIAANVPMVVLVDGNTRQAAVLLAAQLGSNGTTTVLGQPTQGTDRQTKFFVLPSGAAVELAVARWQTGDRRALPQGLVPLQMDNSPDPINTAIQTLANVPAALPAPEQRPMVIAQEGRIGRFQLGFDTRNIDSSLLGNVDTISGASGANVFRPNSDLKIFYLQDYILFTYRNQGVLNSYFADRIYITHPNAKTVEGVGIGSTYQDVIRIYGRRGENGYNEIAPYPAGSREYSRSDRFYVNYDRLGLSFTFESGSNRVVAIGLYKPGS